MAKQIFTEDLEKLLREMQELRNALQNITRPPEQVILDDVGLRSFLEVSKRTTAYWREKGMITFYKLGGKIFYKLSEILAFIHKYEIKSIDKNLTL